MSSRSDTQAIEHVNGLVIEWERPGRPMLRALYDHDGNPEGREATVGELAFWRELQHVAAERDQLAKERDYWKAKCDSDYAAQEKEYEHVEQRLLEAASHREQLDEAVGLLRQYHQRGYASERFGSGVHKFFRDHPHLLTTGRIKP